MAIYRVAYNGFDLWTPGVTDLISPVVEIELNTAGRLTFSLPPDHPNFYTIQPLKGTMVVWEKNDIIWFGRPVSLERNMKNQKSVYCEGALAYFNDSAQRPREKANITAAELFSSILETHNAQVPADRQFTAGTVNVDALITWENGYTDTLNAVKSMLEEAGGYLIPRRDGSTNYLDYLADLEKLDPGQPVQFGLNMTDFNREYNFAGKVTAVLPVGGVPEGVESPITIADVNGGSDILESGDVSEFGRIVKTVTYNEITDPAVLLAAGKKYLDSANFSPFTIKAKAADLSFIDSRYDPFRVGYQYYVESFIHDVYEWLPLMRLSIAMDSAVREIELQSTKAGSEAVLSLLRVIYLYGETELGSREYWFPIGYVYNLENPYLDISGDNHQIIYRPLSANVSGTMPEIYTEVEVQYAIALDLDKETGFLNIVSVDSFTQGSSGEYILGVIA